MTAEDVYEEIKASLRYFGLSFHEMKKVKVTISDAQLVLSHKESEVRIRLPRAE